MDDKFIKELSDHVCRATVMAMKIYLCLSFTVGFALGICIFSIIFLIFKG